MEISGKNLLGSKLSSDGNEVYQAKNPSNGDNLPVEFVVATKGEINQAVQSAAEAFRTYRTLSSSKRAEFLDAIADQLTDAKESLLPRFMAETALPEGRFQVESTRTVNQLKMFADLLREGSWVNARIDPEPDIRQMQKPIGPVAVFGASNFPLAFSVAGGDTASALAAGCPVIVKAHPLHPGTSEMVGQAILKAADKTGMPEGVFSLIHGHVDAGLELVRHPLITAVGFTGSFRGGKALYDAACERPVPIPVYAEMGSSNPMFILPGAMKDRAKEIAEGLAGSVTMGVGQFCTKPGLVIMTNSTDSGFENDLSNALGQIPAGTLLSDGIRENYLSKSASLGQKEGVKEMNSTESHENTVPGKVFSVKAQEYFADPEMEEEIFGPATLLIQSDDKEEMIRFAESLSGHLTATLHGTPEDLADYSGLVDILEQKVGRLIFNGFPTGVAVCHSMHHGGPFPATTAPWTTSVGTAAIYRFTKPVCYQGFPQTALPEELGDKNVRQIMRLVDGEYTTKSI